MRVNLDMGKTFYSWLMMRDKKIPGTVVRNSGIPEELGRIDYLFSDKTGTLTQNEMVFKKLHLGSVSFTSERVGDIADHVRRAATGNAATAPDPFLFSSSRTTAQVYDVIEAIALCHNVTPVSASQEEAASS